MALRLRTSFTEFNRRRIRDIDNSSVRTNHIVAGTGEGLVFNETDGLTLQGATHFSRSTGRYYLEEFFKRKVGINADILNAAEAVNAIANTDFEILGTNAVSADQVLSVNGGFTLTTAGADNDQVIVLPHLDANQSSWNITEWGTENQLVYECLVTTPAAVTTVLFWAGLKLTNTPVIITDADQVYFRFSTDDVNVNWRIISSIGGTDTNTDSGIVVAVNTTYRFKIFINAARVARFYIDDALLFTTAALTNAVDLIPFVGVQALAVAARTLTLHHEKLSRVA